MKIFNLPHSLFQILANTNSDGKVLWTTTNPCMSNSTSSSKEIATKFFSNTPLFSNHPSFLTDDYLQKLAPKVELNPENDDQYICSFNTLPYFGLPNNNIMEEMKSLASFFVIIKNYNKEYYSHFPLDFNKLSLNISVNPKQSKEDFVDVTKCFSLVSLNNNLNEDQNEFLKNATKHLQNTIKKDNYLMQFAYHYVTMLQCDNKYAWSNNTTETFFRPETNPLNKNISNHPKEYKLYNENVHKDKGLLGIYK